MTKISLLFRKGRREDGQALVEFALVLPVLLVIVLAIMKFGILFEQYLTLTDAVRGGARTLAIGRGTANACTTADNQVVNSATGLGLQTSQISHTFTAPDSCTSLTSGNAVTITATYPVSVSIMGVTFLSTNLNVSATERVE